MSGSRRNSTNTQPPTPPSTQPATPTLMSAPLTPNFNSRRSLTNTPRKINPVRRCQSMRYPNLKNGLSLTPQPSLKSRRVSSTPSSLENGRTNESEFVKYYQYKTNKADPISLLNIAIADEMEDFKEYQICRFLVVGVADCGKSSLISQFHNFLTAKRKARTEDNYVNNNSKISTNGNSHNNNNGDTLVINFREMASLDSCLPKSPIAMYQPDGYIIVYAVNDRTSFEGAKTSIDEIFKWDDVEQKPIILVANKTDLVRSRVVSKHEGRQLAINNNCKYIEISCAISHNVDFLLAGIRAQINLRNKQTAYSARKPNIFKRILRKAALNKSKSCDNLHVL
ncbi:RAS related protein-like protein [Leptotrombidium deliense]|uniref:RAS related protein-like protein n=1 Tax=Leptotrombidium deliense TaxID=299467 RepID=A0A443SM98_9ACAR|nr:RAS related protein-like protein [Leptotrombidium deliense]